MRSLNRRLKPKDTAPMRKIRFLALPVALLAAGCVQHIAAVPSRSAVFAPWSDQPRLHVLGAGDRLDLRFALEPGLNSRLAIGPEGDITAPLIGPVAAAGKTVPQIKTLLRRRYASVLRDPAVDVLVAGYGSARVYVGGEVHSPGVETLTGPTDVLQGVILAGGVLPTAKLSEVIVLRRGAGTKPMLRTVNLKSLIGRGDRRDDVMLAPNDVVYVPKSTIASFDLFVQQYLTDSLPFQKNLSVNIGNGFITP